MPQPLPLNIHLLSYNVLQNQTDQLVSKLMQLITCSIINALSLTELFSVLRLRNIPVIVQCHQLIKATISIWIYKVLRRSGKLSASNLYFIMDSLV